MISVNCRTVKVGHFPAGEQNILDFRHDISDENTIVWKYESDEELVTLIYICFWEILPNMAYNIYKRY